MDIYHFERRNTKMKNEKLLDLAKEIKEVYPKKAECNRSTQIEIPRGPTLVILVGTQGSGKTTFIEEKFKQIECEITSMDKMFLNIFKELLTEKVSADIAVDIAEDLAEVECMARIKDTLERNKIAVLDGCVLDFFARMETIEELAMYYKKVVQITLIREETWIREHLYNRMKKQGITIDEIEKEVAEDKELLQIQLDNELLQIGIDKAYLLQNQEIDLAKISII